MTISAGGVSSDPSVVSTSGTTATVLESFNGNLTDAWPNSTLNGGGFTVNATGYLADTAVVAVTATGITVEDLSTVSTASTDGILVVPSVAAATIEDSSVALPVGSTSAVGVQVGNVFPSSAVEPTGTFVINGTKVTGPGAAGGSPQVGIAVYGASVIVTDNTVSGFTYETTTTSDGSTYSAWTVDSQAVGIFVGCAGGASACLLQSNVLRDNSIGLVAALVTSGLSSITPQAAPLIEGNSVAESLAYGMVVEPTGAVETATVEHNLVDNSLSGAPGAFLLGASFQVTNNVFYGTSAGGSNGALQGEGSCSAPSIATASIEASDCGNPTTDVTLEANLFEETAVPYWSATFPSYPSTSYLSSGELVTFTESGLTAGTVWSVTLAGTVGSVAAPNAILGQLQNGSQSYSIGAFRAWFQQTLPPSGTLTVNGSAVTMPTIVFLPLAVGQVVITGTCASTNTSLVAFSGLTATVLRTFAGNITDECPGSVLNGGGHTLIATVYPGDANVVGLTAPGITVKDVVTVSTGATDGIYAGADVSSATVQDSTVTLASGSSTATGVQLGNVLPSSAVQPTGTFVVNGTTVNGPGPGGGIGEVGILVYGASVTVTYDTVSNFSLETTTTSGGSTYSAWIVDTQSVGIFVGCAGGATTCFVASNVLVHNSIGIVSALDTSALAPIAPQGPPLVDGNTIRDSLAYGMVLDPAGASGTATVVNNLLDNSLSGAPGVFVLGATFSLAANVFLGTSPAGSNGALQGQGSCATPSITTASVEASDCASPVTTVAMSANLFAETSPPYWSVTFPVNPSESSLSGGELVTFPESGLAAGTVWTLTLAGTVGSVAAPFAIVGQLTNGSYSFSVHPVVGYTVSPKSGSVTVNGTALTVPITFTQVTYSLTFHESGLPAGTLWSVTINGHRQNSTGTTDVLLEPNGTWTYTPASPEGYSASPGRVHVNGANVTVNVVFVPYTYAVSFAESGLSPGRLWWVNLSTDQSFHAKKATIVVQLTNGTYSYHASAANTSLREYTATGGTFSVIGFAIPVTVQFTTYYPVTFERRSLPAGIEWWVNVTGEPGRSSTGTKLTIFEPSGNYTYTVATLDKEYAASGGSFMVRHAAVVRGVSFVLVKFQVTFTESGLPSGVRWCVAVTGGGTHCTKLGSVSFPEPNGTYAYTLTAARAGYTGTGGSFQVAGAAVTVDVTFASG